MKCGGMDRIYKEIGRCEGVNFLVFLFMVVRRVKG